MRERRGHRASGPAVFRTAAIVASAAAVLWGAGGGVWGSRDSETSVSVTNSTANAVNVGIRVQTAKAASLPYMPYAPFNANNYIGADACGVWVSGNSVFGDSWIASYYNGQYDFEAIPIPDVTRTPGEAV